MPEMWRVVVVVVLVLAAVPVGIEGRAMQEYPIEPLKYSRLKVGEVKPSGWLGDQLNAEADGLAGHLADFYPYVSDSVWIGGKTQDPGESERVPYWLNGVVPLAVLTDNEHLKAAVWKYVDYIMSHQAEDGWLGPDCCDTWPRFPLLLAFTQYAESNTSDSRTVPVILKFLQRFSQEIDQHPLTDWAQYRWQDLILTIWWLLDNVPSYEHHLNAIDGIGSDSTAVSAFLIQLAQKVYTQRFDWSTFVSGPNFPKAACTGSCCSLATHGVNVGQGIKDTAVWYRFSKEPALIQDAITRSQIIDQYHGRADGSFTCSEHLAGLNPSQGTETCTVVETMFSYETLFSVFGNVSDAERVEQLAFNSLPGSMTSDQWAHVYLQQHNQINSMTCNPSIWVSDGPDSNIYGLEPNFGCCTVNFPQGWPKYVTHMFAKTQDGGLAAVLYGPAIVNTTLNGKSVIIEVTTDYPFSDTILFTIDAETEFNFHIRVPSWAVSPVITIDGNPNKASPASFYNHTIQTGHTSIKALFPSQIRTRINPLTSSVSLLKGSLLYSLKLQTKATQTRHYAFNSYDWLIMPLSSWNYAIELDMKNPSGSFQVVSKAVGPEPFSAEGAPIMLLGKGRQLNSWGEARNAANPPPQSPVTSSSPQENVVLIPYGANQLRITEFPYINLDS